MPFDADAIPRGDHKSTELIPGGTRLLVRVEHAMEAVSQAGNDMVEVRLRVASGPYSGASIFERHTMTGKGAVFLADLSRAVGHPRWAQASELERRSCEVEVKVEEQAGYQPRNRIAKYIVPVAVASSPPPFDESDVPF